MKIKERISKNHSKLPDCDGPYLFNTGRVLYYDRKEQKWYDRNSDWYVENEDVDPLGRFAIEWEIGDMVDVKGTPYTLVEKRTDRDNHVTLVWRNPHNCTFTDSNYKTPITARHIAEWKLRGEEQICV